MIVLKIILWILLVILVIAVTALCIPTGIVVEYKNETVLKIRYLFLTIPLVPKKEKKKKQKSNKSKSGSDKVISESQDDFLDEQKSNEDKINRKKKTVSENKEDEPSAFSKIRDLYKEKGLDGFIRIIKEISKLAGRAGKSIFKGITLKKLDINIAVATGDAAETAIKYGYVCAGVYPALSVLLSSLRFKDYSVEIKPDFDNDEPVVNCLAEISIIPWVAVGIAAKALFRFIILKIKGIL